MDGQKKLSKMCAPFSSASQFYVPDWTVANHRRFRAFCAFPMVCLPSQQFLSFGLYRQPIPLLHMALVVRANGNGRNGTENDAKMQKEGDGCRQAKGDPISNPSSAKAVRAARIGRKSLFLPASCRCPHQPRGKMK